RARAESGASLRSALSDRRLRTWAVAEVLFASGWAGTLVYSGALFVESYGCSGAATGLLLAAAAGAYVLGNFTFRRAAGGAGRQALVSLSLLSAVAVPLFGAVRVGAAGSALLFAAAAFVAGARTLVSNSYGLRVAERRQWLATMGLRAATTQLG